MAHVAPYKKEIVKKVVDKIKQYPIIGIVNMENLPAQQLQKMRDKLRDKVDIFMTKKRLMKIAFEQAKADKKDIDKLTEYFRGMPALIFTKDNPFTLFKILKDNKSSAPAKGGQIAPNDIEVKAGKTSFAPGPIIGELGQFGIKTGVDAGKIAIKEDHVVCKEGEEISQALAGILTRLGIEPMEVGLDLIGIYEDGTIFTKKVLDIDQDQFLADFASAASAAHTLSIEIGHFTKENISQLLTKAHRDAHTLGVEKVIVSKDTVKDLISRAECQMNSLNSL